MERLLADLRVALRRVRKRIGFTIVAVVSLALGIGANTAIFSLVDAILLRRAPLPHAERVAEIYQKQPDFPFAPFSYPDYRDFRDATHAVFTQLSLSRYAAASRDVGDRVETMVGELVSGDYFPLLGIRPVIGRLLGPDDDISPGGHAVVVISYDYWQHEFNADQHVVGKALRRRDRSIVLRLHSDGEPDRGQWLERAHRPRQSFSVSQSAARAGCIDGAGTRGGLALHGRYAETLSEKQGRLLARGHTRV
jgi:hypothetical protein